MKNYEQFLKKQGGSGKQAGNMWTLENLEAGFEKYYDVHGHYPSSPELDKFEYLPSSRQIQRMFGGLVNLRMKLRLENEALNHNEGSLRSETAGMAMDRASKYEEEYYYYLIKRIPELYVHEHKVIRHKGSKTSTDYFIYFPNSNNGIAIDLFYAIDIQNLLKQIRIKEQKYNTMPFKTYFVCMNGDITQEQISSSQIRRKSELSQNIEVYSADYFNENILSKVANLFLNSAN